MPFPNTLYSSFFWSVSLDFNFGSLPEPAEDGASPVENARAKARFYYAASGKPTFSADSGLYFAGLPDALQPGVHIRRVNGKRLDDDEMTAYYGSLADRFGGRIIGRYKFATS
jgi:8-oxo-dGTP diphosphatase